MPNVLDANGLQTATQAELVAYFTSQYQAIYGADINLDSDTPDGQMMNIFIQACLDNLDLIAQVNNMFDPDNAVGVILDQRVAINGIQRQAGTYTITPVTVVTSQSVNLYGLDQTAQAPFTVADNAGNQWVLQTTQLAVPTGSNVFNFQAAQPGAQLTVPNTITVQTTIVLGVSSVNNPTTYTTLGVNEESDALLKIRRQKSVALASQGYYAGLLALLENTPGVTAAYIYENNTGSDPDANGVPSHSIWVIVSGTGADSAIANAIYTKRNAGCGMYGSTVYYVTRPDGSLFPIKWDSVAVQNLFTIFTASSINGSVAPNIAGIRTGLASSFVPGVYAEVNINQLATLVQEIDPNCLVTSAGFSLGQTQTLNLSGVAASGAFKLNYAGNPTVSINWNDSAATIQTKLRAVAGLETIVVTGSIVGQSLVLNLASVPDVQSLITVSNNTLLTSGAVAITFAYNEGYTYTLLPSTLKNQFVVASENIIILPMILSPTTNTVDTGASIQFTGLGGYGAYTYSFQTNNSGGTLNGATGAYVAGATGNVTDTILVTDAMGNTATATVAVT